MTSREKILDLVAQNQPPKSELSPIFDFSEETCAGSLLKFIETVTSIGGKVYSVANFLQIKETIAELFPGPKRIVSMLDSYDELAGVKPPSSDDDPHDFEDVNVAILKGQFAVAENGAVWLSEEQMGHRIIPYITEHLVLIIDEKAIVSNMHQAYSKIAGADYGFGCFIAGPSKTADIEQSLVLGAHGARTLTLFILKAAEGRSLD